MEQKKLSIIVPVYNVEGFVKRCLDSIFSQNIPESEFEVIVINDGSYDSSMSIVNDFLDLFNNIKVINQENQGLSAARNIGLINSIGNFVWFIDSDDHIEINCINQIISIIEIYRTDIIVFNYCRVKLNGEVDSIFNKINREFIISGIDCLLLYGAGTAWQHIYSKSFLVQNNLLFKINFLHEDGEFNIRCKSLANNVYLCPKFFYKYTINRKDSIKSKITLKNLFDLLEYSVSCDEFIKEKKFGNHINKVIYSQVILAVTSAIYESRFLSSNEWELFKNEIKNKRSLLLKMYLGSEFIKHKIIGVLFFLFSLSFIEFFRFYILVRNRYSFNLIRLKLNI